MLDFPLRTIQNPNLSVREINDLIMYLKSLDTSRRLVDTKYGTSNAQTLGKEKSIQIEFNEDYEPYSIFRITPSGKTFEFRKPTALVYFSGTVLEDPDNKRSIYCTNGGEPIFGFSGGAVSECEIIGTDKPHIIRYTGSDPTINDRMDKVDSGVGVDESSIQKSNVGRFTCVSEPDTVRKLVWVTAHHLQLSYIPWVRTCTSDQFPTYPVNPLGNVFCVERGVYSYTPRTQPGGAGSGYFIRDEPMQYYIAYNPCGWIPEGSIRQMSEDRGRYYLLNACGIPTSSSSLSSSSRPSSSSVPSSSSSHPSSSSSIPSSSSSIPPSSSSSIPPSSSSVPPSSSSSIPPSSSATPSSSSSIPSILCDSDECEWTWFGTSWIRTSIAFFPCETVGCSCAAPGFSGSFVGEVVYTSCHS